MSYTTYEYYTDTYLGDKIPSESFAKYSLRASEDMDEVVNGDITELLTSYNTQLQKTNCAIADLLYADENEKSSNLASEKTLTYSVSYDNSKTKSLSSNIYNAYNKYLGRTGLLFRGV